MELKRGHEIELEINDYAFGGKGISRLKTEMGEYIIFVQNAIPGQVVKAKIMKKKKNYAECRLIKVIKTSPLESPTSFQPISGAPYINLPIENQHDFKLKSTNDKTTPITLVRLIIAKKPLSEKQICNEIFKLTTLSGVLAIITAFMMGVEL